MAPTPSLAPPASVPIFSLSSVVPSVLSAPLSSAPPLTFLLSLLLLLRVSLLLSPSSLTLYRPLPLPLFLLVLRLLLRFLFLPPLGVLFLLLLRLLCLLLRTFVRSLLLCLSFLFRLLCLLCFRLLSLLLLLLPFFFLYCSSSGFLFFCLLPLFLFTALFRSLFSSWSFVFCSFRLLEFSSFFCFVFCASFFVLSSGLFFCAYLFSSVCCAFCAFGSSLFCSSSYLSSFSTAPPPGFSSSVSFLSSSLPPSSAPSFPPGPSFSVPSASWSSLPSSASSSVPPSSDFRPVSSSVSSPLGFAAYQANVLGLSAEYQALGRWHFASGGKDFPAYLSAHFPHLYSDFRLDFSSGSSRFLSALSSAPPPVQVPAAPAPTPLASSSSLLPSSLVPSSSFATVSAFPSAAFPFFVPPVASAPSAPLPPSAPPLSHSPGFHPSLSSSPYSLRTSWSFPAESSLGAPVSAGLGVAAGSVSQGASSVSAPSFFRLFVSSSDSSSVPSAPLAPALSSSSAGVPPDTSSFLQSTPSFDPAAAFGFASAEDLPEDSPPDAVPRVLDPGLAAVPEAVRSEFHRMLALISFCRLRVLPLFLHLRMLFSKTFFPPLHLLLHRSISIGLRGFGLHSLRLTLASPVVPTEYIPSE